MSYFLSRVLFTSSICFLDSPEQLVFQKIACFWIGGNNTTSNKFVSFSFVCDLEVLLCGSDMYGIISIFPFIIRLLIYLSPHGQYYSRDIPVTFLY